MLYVSQMSSGERILLDYPLSTTSVILRFCVSAVVSCLYLYLAFQTNESLFNVGFLASFTFLLLFNFIYRVINFLAMYKTIILKGEYRKEKRGGHIELLYNMLLFISPFFLFIFINSVLALGILFGVISALGILDSLFYLYVKSKEAHLGGYLKAFIEKGDKPGRYVWGLSLHSKREIDRS